MNNLKHELECEMQEPDKSCICNEIWKREEEKQADAQENEATGN